MAGDDESGLSAELQELFELIVKDRDADETDLTTDMLRMCERAHAVGNTQAVQKALQFCREERILPPDWLYEAAELLISDGIDPFMKRPRGRHARAPRKLEEMLKHLRRLECVRRNIYRGKVTLQEAYARCADRDDELKGSKDPAGTIAASYAHAIEILNNPEERTFIAPFYCPLHLWLYRKSTAIGRRKTKQSG